MGSETGAACFLTRANDNLHRGQCSPSGTHGNQARRSDSSLTLQLPAPLVTAMVMPRRAQLFLLGVSMALCGEHRELRDAGRLEGDFPPDSCWETGGHRTARWGFL